MVLWLAEKFLAEGKRVGILSRGYRGTSGSGDEVELLRRRLGDCVAFGVGADRFEEGSKIEARQDVDIFLLDDGFQHLQLARDVDIVLMDSSRPLHKESLLPAGRLREPRVALNRADVVVLTRTDLQDVVSQIAREFSPAPTCSVTTKLLGFRKVSSGRKSTASLEQQLSEPAFVFCGIGNPSAFLADVERWGVQTKGKRFFRDHHSYSTEEVRELERQAQQVGARVLLTTEKDVQNLGDMSFLQMPIYYCEIAMNIPDEVQLLAEIKRKLEEPRSAAK